MIPLVLIAHVLPDDWTAALQGRCRVLAGPAAGSEGGSGGLAPELAQRLPEADGLLTLLIDRVDERLLSGASRLKVVSNMAVGVDNLDLAACTRAGIPVGNTPGVLTEATADLTMALLLAAARRLPESSADARAGLWSTWSPTGWLGADLAGATLGIVGMGKIGRAVAARAHAFNLRLVYTDPQRQADLEESLGASFLPLEALLQESDFVSLHTPLLPETRKLIDGRALKRMKPNAILINAARGPIVDPEALVQALQEGWIAAAALDVTDPEPLHPSHPLYRLPNCLVVPHIGSATRGTRKRMAELACENLLAGLEGRPLPHCANPQVYDRHKG